MSKAIIIYSDNAGRVIRVSPADDDNNDGMLPLTIDGWDGFDGHTAIVTSVGFDRQVKAQFRDMFDKSVYVYVFGDKLIDLVISGLLFARRCDANTQHGMDGLMEYYDANAVSMRNDAIRVQVGGTKAMHALLYGVKVNMDDNEHGIGKFTLLFKAIQDTAGSTPSNATQPITTTTTTNGFTAVKTITDPDSL